MFGILEITDPRSFRALAHPLRLDLIEVLGAVGPQTAAACGRRLGTTQANCSFHLRQLAKYGFVEEAEASGDGRERPWQLTELEQRWSSDAGAAAEQFERVFVAREAERILNWLERSRRVETEGWRHAAFLGGATLPLSKDELSSIRDDLRAVLAPYVERLGDRTRWPEDARLVRVLLGGTPLELNTEEDDE
jgi:DNA-binding MarR family transcriptional regulator